MEILRRPTKAVRRAFAGSSVSPPQDRASRRPVRGGPAAASREARRHLPSAALRASGRTTANDPGGMATDSEMEIASVAAEQLFVDFVNSQWYDGRGRFEDRLLDPAWRGWLFREWQLRDPGKPTRPTLRRLQRLREVLRRIVEDAHAGRVPSTRPLHACAADLQSISMRLAIHDEPPTAEWSVRSPSWAFVEGEVIRSCLGFLSRPAAGRLRRCENEGCLWAFVDASRNGSRRWCDPGICGNAQRSAPTGSGREADDAEPVAETGNRCLGSRRGLSRVRRLSRAARRAASVARTRAMLRPPVIRWPEARRTRPAGRRAPLG